MGIIAYLQMQIGGPALHGNAQQIVNVHSTLPPDNLPYDDLKSHSSQDDLGNGTGRCRGEPLDYQSAHPHLNLSSRAEEKVSEANFRAFEGPLISEPVAKAGVKFSESTDFSSQGSFDSAQDDTIFCRLSPWT